MPRTWFPSVTVAAIMERQGRFLLVEEEIRGRAVFNQPAGHWEPGESLVQACVREALEETAHDFTPTALVGIYDRHEPAEGKTYLRFAFCGETGKEQPGRKLDKGILRAVWLTAEELRALSPRHRSPVVMRCVEDYLAGRRYPLELLQHAPA
jgi:ADP-ribose pyrophosphatase YjhB (NUDIX family)